MREIPIACDYCLTEEVCKRCPVVECCAHTPGHGHGEEYERFLERIGFGDEQVDQNLNRENGVAKRERWVKK